ncbi:hypothetical protein IP87_10345 [beta proteobacterium AAP121]|nr:hypothetical protein IP80_04265 [beta proteobacterium AAP65]KPF97860.1 hypothetical protein IP87_10345 [beta proteobacterium AAP121]
MCCAVPALAQGAVLTLLEGEATLVDGARRVAAVPGVRLKAGTLVETGASTGLLRLEWPDRTVVDLGPATKAMVQPPGFAARNGKAPVLYLLQGWAKLSGGSEASGGLVTAAFDVLPLQGTAVVQAMRPQPAAFAETGTLVLVERPSAKRQTLPTGGWWGGRLEARPPAGWMGGVPRAFRDTLPLRADTFKDRAFTPAPLPAPTYEALADWLGAEPALRRDFPRRFEALAQEPAFRRALQSKMSAHPEWARLLNPPEPRP